MIPVRLEHLDLTRGHSLGGDILVVVLQLVWSAQIAVQVGMDKGEMRHVEEAHYRSKCIGLVDIRAGMNLPECRVIPGRKRRHVA